MPDPTKLSEQNRAKLDGIVQNMVLNNESEDDINFVVNDFKSKYSEKKKDNSSGIAPSQELDLAPNTGSLGGKSTQGFPKIDTNSVAPGMGVQPRAEAVISPTKKEDKNNSLFKKTNELDTSSLGGPSLAPKQFNFSEQGLSEQEQAKRSIKAKKGADDLFKKNQIAESRATQKPLETGRRDSFASGVYNAFESILETVPLAYDAIGGLVVNPIVEALGGEKISSEKFAKEWGLDRFVPEVYTKRKAELEANVKRFNDERGGDVLGAFEDGRIIDAADMITSSSLQSLPQMAVAIASGGGKTAMTAIGVTTAASRNAELKEENPEMELHTRVLNAGVSGFIEATVGQMMSGASGIAVRKILAKEGAEATSKLFSGSFRKNLANFIGKNPVVGTVGEVGEETLVSVFKQMNDIATGVRTEPLDFRQATNDGISAMGLGIANTVAVYGSKAYTKSVDYNKAKAVNKEIYSLSNELTNENLSDSDKEILKSKISRLSAGNKKLINDSLDKADALPVNVKEELTTIESSIDNLKEQILSVQDNKGISESTKQALIAEIKEQGKELYDRKQKVIDGNYIYDDFDKLPQEAKNRLKNEAGRILLAEAQKNGETTASFDDAQLSKKAAELHNEELKSEVNLPLGTEQAQENGLETAVSSPQNENPTTQTSAPTSQEVATPSVSENPTNVNLLEATVEGSHGEFVIGNATKKEGQNTTINAFEDAEGNVLRFKTKEEAQAKLQELQNLPVVEQTTTDTKEQVAEAEPAPSVSTTNNIEIKKLEEERDSKLFLEPKGIPQEELIKTPSYINNRKIEAEYNEKINQLKNEATPSQNPPADGNVQLGIGVVEQDGVSKPESTPAENVPETVDGGAGKNDAEVVPVYDKNNKEIGSKKYKEQKNQVKGRTREITIADGSKIKGTYKVVSSDDIIASHNEQNFSKSNGYPVNDRGETINDRDYETDKNSQSEVVKIAQDFDGRAIQQTPVVTKDGVVVDGNNRVMSRKIAAKNSTDLKYKESLEQEADMYGVDPFEIKNIKNPILVFEAESPMPYNTQSLAKFNKQDKKEKSSSGKAVEYSKTLSDKSKRQIAEVYDEADRPSDVTSNPKSVKKLRDILIDNGIIQTNEIPRYFDVDKGVMTKEGVSLMENIAIGSTFNQQTINTLSLPGMGDIRNKILQSLVGLINNGKLDVNFSLSTEIAKAIEVIYELKNSNQTIEEYLSQPDLLGEKLFPTIEEYATILALGDGSFKNWLINYNNNIGQPDIFKIDGDPITTKKDITDETIRSRKKQIPSNLRSNAERNATKNGPSNGNLEGEGKNKPNDKGNDGEGNPNGAIEHASTHNRTNSLSSERVPYAKITPKNSPKKLVTIIQDVSKGLKATLIYGRSGRRNSAGSYNPRNTLVRISRAGDIDTVAHELGHLLDDRHNILGTIPEDSKLAIIRQLKWYSERGGSNPPQGISPAKKAEYLEREGLAEFIRSYIANPKQTEVIAPELLAHFDAVIDAKTKQVLNQFSNDFLDYANGSKIERTLANIEDVDLPHKNEFIEWIKGFRKSDDKLAFSKMDTFYAEMANSNHFGIKAFKTLVAMEGKTELKSHENFEIMSRVFLGINGKLENIFASGMINAKNEKLKAEGGVFSKNKEGRTVYDNGTAMNVEWLINGLDTTTEETLKKEMNEVIAMAVAERTIEYAKKLERTDGLTGIGGSLDSDLSVAVDTMEEFSEMKKIDPEKYNRIKDGVKRYRQMADATLQYAVDKGRISVEQYEKIKEGNEYYVALNRNIELEPGEDIFSSFNTGTNGIGAAKELILKVKGGTATIENPYLSLLKNMNSFIKEADRNEVMLSFVEPLKSTRQMGEGEAVNLAQIGRLANDGDKNTIKVFVDGKLEKWQFHDDIYKSLKNIESISTNPIMDFLGKPSQLIRWTVTNNPVFYARNIVKDTQARLVVSNDHSSIKDMFHSTGDKELFELFGGSQAGHLHTSKESYSKTMSETAKAITKKRGIIIDPRTFGRKYSKFLQTGENLNRIAEFNNSYKEAKKRGMSDYDAGLYAAFEARDLMDFAVAGHTMREINKVIVFSNAGVQSLRKARKALLKDPAGFAYRTALYSVLPSLLFASLRNAMGDDEEYEELPANQRDMFFNFKTPFTGDAWISIPKPYELGLVSAFVDRASSKIRGHDEAFDGIAGTTLKTLMPFDESSFLGGLKPIIETQMNRDTYSGRAIVPEHEKDKLLELRKGTNKSSFIGQNLSNMMHEAGMSVDPRNIDHIMKGYGTYFANQGIAITDLAKKERAEVNFWISKSGFAKDVPTYSSNSVRKTTNLAVEIGKINSKGMKSLRSAIEEFYTEQDLNKRKVMIKDIYAKSEELRIKLESEKIKILREAAEKKKI